MDDLVKFQNERVQSINELGQNPSLQSLAMNFIQQSQPHKYTYNFDWLGLPIIQFPQDILAIQEIIWKIKPDIIVETGIARGGSLILSASILHLLNGKGKVVGVDIDIRPHNRKAIEAHPLAHRIDLIQGSSTDLDTFNKVKTCIAPGNKVLVILDSNHTHEHVLEELHLYSQLVTAGSYLIVMDTVIADMHPDTFQNMPWSKEKNPKTSVREFLKNSDRFKVDFDVQNKLLITAAPEGYLKCLR